MAPNDSVLSCGTKDIPSQQRWLGVSIPNCGQRSVGGWSCATSLHQHLNKRHRHNRNTSPTSGLRNRVVGVNEHEVGIGCPLLSSSDKETTSRYLFLAWLSSYALFVVREDGRRLTRQCLLFTHHLLVMSAWTVSQTIQIKLPTQYPVDMYSVRGVVESKYFYRISGLITFNADAFQVLPHGHAPYVAVISRLTVLANYTSI